MDPFWAAILGGAVAGVIVAVVESFLGRSREHERWLREQRQRSYADFTSAITDLRRCQFDAIADLAQHGDLGITWEDKLHKAVVEVELALNRLRMVASRRLIDFAGAVETRAYEAEWAAQDRDLGGLRRSALSVDHIEDFTDLARAELGAGRDVWYLIRQRFGRQEWPLREGPKPHAESRPNAERSSCSVGRGVRTQIERKPAPGSGWVPIRKRNA